MPTMPTRPLDSTIRAVVPPLVQLESFEGPLDLLLHLVRVGEMDIFDLPIARLCDQYMEHLNDLDSLDLSIAGEFLVMASTLLEIKSRLLLPPPPREILDDAEDSEGHDPRAELVQRLLEYSKYQAVAETLQDREGERRDIFFRPATDWSDDFAVRPRFGELSPNALLQSLRRMLADVGADERMITSVRRRKLTLRMKMREVLTRTRSAEGLPLPLSALLPAAPFELMEIVLLFLALLELLRLGSIRVLQESFCGEIEVMWVPESEREQGVIEDTVEALTHA